jgi:hypothetical protein
MIPEESYSMKIALVAAITFTLGATAFAGEVVKKDTKALAVSAKAMTDKDMDKVTVMSALAESLMSGGGQSYHRNSNNGYNNSGGKGACFTC